MELLQKSCAFMVPGLCLIFSTCCCWDSRYAYEPSQLNEDEKRKVKYLQACIDARPLKKDCATRLPREDPTQSLAFLAGGGGGWMGRQKALQNLAYRSYSYRGTC